MPLTSLGTMEHIAPLIQTALWVALVAGIVIRFHRPIHALLVALQQRIEAGSAIEAGPFKLGADLRPTPAVQQRQRSEAELAQIVTEQLELPGTSADQTAGASAEPPKLRSRFFLAEELALRAVQTEFNAPINRQVSIAPGVETDGAFIHKDELHVVEVKYIVRPKNAESTIRNTLAHYERAFGDTRKRSIILVLALVYEHEADIAASRARFEELARQSELRVIVRGYSRKTLQSTFGLPADDV